MDRGSYEKLSIRDSARSLKKYGSTSKHVNKNENYIRHYVTNSDTLQGIALKYNVTIEQIRRVNKLWASDSLFLKEYLSIPITDNTQTSCSTNTTPTNDANTSSASETPITSPTSPTSFDEDSSVSDFLGKIDAAIAITKNEVKKVQSHSEFLNSDEIHRIKGSASAVRLNNNGSNDYYSTPQTVIVQQGKRVKTSLQHHEKQQAELFEL